MNSIVLIPLDARNRFLGEEGPLDRIDRVLLILPVFPIADLSSTLFALNFGGEEIGILARPILQNYGPSGLIVLSLSASAIFLILMQVVLHVKRLFIKELRFRLMWHVLAVPIYWFFLLEAVYVSTVVSNLLIPLAFPMVTSLMVRIILGGTYFALISALTRPYIRQLPSFQTFEINVSKC